MKAIWINKRDEQIRKCYLKDKFNAKYEVYEIKKDYQFTKIVKSISFKFYADTVSYIYINDKLVAPVNFKSPGDFYVLKTPIKEFYYSNASDDNINSKELLLRAFVQFYPSKMCDFSSKSGGFILKGKVTFVDGTTENITSDDSYLIRLNNCFDNIASFDNTKALNKFKKAVYKELDLKLKETDIPMMDLTNIFKHTYLVKKKNSKMFVKDFSKIYSAKYTLVVECSGLIEGKIISYENNNKTNINYFKSNHSDKIHYFDLESVGKFSLWINNKSNQDAKITLILDHCHYPYKDIKLPITKNKRLNDLYDKCLFACINCSQSFYLDSPKHQEPFSSCMGDYQIISLALTKVSKDYRLLKHVLKGISDTLYINKGVIANSNYALIYIHWLYKVYMLCKDKELLRYCLKGVISTIKLFKKFVGNKGVIDHPYNYIFVDWLVFDGYNLFSPPMALGQTVLNMYYYKALDSLAKIYHVLGDLNKSNKTLAIANKTKKAIIDVFYDKNLGLFKEGCNTPLDKNYKPFNNDKSKGIPENIDKVYYHKHSNVLAVAFNIVDGKVAKNIMDKIFNELKDQPIQPFFSFYTFEALKQSGLMKKYKNTLLNEWLKRIKLKDKGLPEGFYKPDPNYIFDYSHAWGSAPLCFIDD